MFDSLFISLYKSSKMISKHFPSITTPPHKHPLIFQSNISTICHHQHKLHTPINLSVFGLERNHHRTRTRLPLILASRGSNDGDNRAVETVLRLYEAIKNKNLSELSEIIGHDCFCVCNFVSTFKTFSGKKVRSKSKFQYLSSNGSQLPLNYEF